MTEKDFQAQLVALVDMLGGLAYHPYDSRRSVAGYPDLTIVTRDRRVIFAELKVGKRKPTEDQWAWLRALPAHLAYLWRPDDWDDAVRIIQTGHHGRNESERTCIGCGNDGHIMSDAV